MSPRLNLRILTPLAVAVDEAVLSLRAENAGGGFGVLPGHADFLTRLSVSVVSWQRPGGAGGFCAVRGGALTVRSGAIDIATREAVPGQDLATLDRDVLARFRAEADEDRVEHVESTRLHLAALRQMLVRLQPRARGAGT